MRSQNKYGNVPTGGYRSKAEAQHAMYLESEKQAGRIKSFEYEVRYPLEVNGKLIATIIPDFTVTFPNKRVVIHEVKGGRATQTDLWRIKSKLFQVLYPHIKYEVHQYGYKPKGRTFRKAFVPGSNVIQVD